jgi:Ras-related protein Rab-11A
MEEKENEKYEIEEDVSLLQKEYLRFKLIIVGDTGVGKTNIIGKYIADSFNENTKSTVGVEFFTKSFKINEDYIKLEIWDTAGQERYKSITSAYYKGSNGALLVYDITRTATFDDIEKWINEVKDVVEGQLKFVLVGNKSDLENERKVETETALAKAQKLKMPLIETSAFNSTNIQKVFKIILIDIYKNFKKEKKEKNDKKILNEGIKIDMQEGKQNQKELKKEGGSCC